MNETVLRKQLLKLLDGGNAHITFKEAVADYPIEKINLRISEIPYSSWELVEHMRIAQYDILDFIVNPKYAELRWPDDYWPSKNKHADENDWLKTIQGFIGDQEDLKEIVNNLKTDLTISLPHAPEYTIFREILLAADHNSYHLGQLISLKRIHLIY